MVNEKKREREGGRDTEGGREREREGNTSDNGEKIGLH